MRLERNASPCRNFLKRLKLIIKRERKQILLKDFISLKSLVNCICKITIFTTFAICILFLYKPVELTQSAAIHKILYEVTIT